MRTFVLLAYAAVVCAVTAQCAEIPTIRQLANLPRDTSAAGVLAVLKQSGPCMLPEEPGKGTPEDFVEVWEDMGGKRLRGEAPAGRLVKLRSSNSTEGPRQSAQASVDLDSLIRIRLDPLRLNPNNLLNRFEIKAELVRWREAKSTPLPVTNYAEIAKDPKDTAKGVTFADAQDQVAVIRALHDSTESLLYDFPVDFERQVRDPGLHLRKPLTYVFGNWAKYARAKAEYDKLKASQPDIDRRVAAATLRAKAADRNLKVFEAATARQGGSALLEGELALARQEDALAKAEETAATAARANLAGRLQALTPDATTNFDAMTERKARIDRRYRLTAVEIEELVKRIKDAGNGPLGKVLLDIFGMPSPILATLGEQYVAQMKILLSAGEGKTKERDEAREFLMLRTATVWNDFAIFRAAVRMLREQCEVPLYDSAVDLGFQIAFREEIDVLKDQIEEGVIDLPAYNPEDGDLVSITMTAQGPARSSGAAGSLKMRIEVRDYRVRTQVSDSLLFIRRHHSFVDAKDVRYDKGFKPVPGVSLLTHFHFRDLRWKGHGKEDRGYFVDRKSFRRILGALSPGVGINASLLNFRESSGCHGPKGNWCEATDGPSFQIGVGPVFSLFDGVAQFTYGWNLSLGQRPAYFGMGFSFLQLVEKGTKLARQAKAARAYGK